MKEFFSNLSNKNKLRVCKGVEYASWIISLMLAFVASNVLLLPLTIIIGIIVGGTASLSIEKKYSKGIRKNYLKELSNDYYLNNKGIIDVDKELKNINVLSRIRYIVKLLYIVIFLTLNFVSLIMSTLAVTGAHAVFGILCGLILIANNILEKIDFRNETVTRVVELAKSDIKDVSLVDDAAMEKTIQERLNCFLPNSYVPLSSQGMKVSGTEYREVRDNWDEYEGSVPRRGPVRARRPDNKRK